RLGDDRHLRATRAVGGNPRDLARGRPRQSAARKPRGIACGARRHLKFLTTHTISRAIQRVTFVTDPNFAGIRACVFDAYGTLFDFASAAAGCADVLGDQAAPLTALWRDKQLQYSRLRAV